MWPPKFTLDQEKILNLLTGDRFYSNPSAALREAILNAIDAVHRRRQVNSDFTPEILAIFNRDTMTLTVADNGVGMSQIEVDSLFAKVGASAATEETQKESVGEFGIGVISYFMAGNTFELQTYDGEKDPIGLLFDRDMLAGGAATVVQCTQCTQGTTITIHIRDDETFEQLVTSFTHWCRDVKGLSAELLPDGRELLQGGEPTETQLLDVEIPQWVERAHLSPILDPIGWEAMTGNSTVAVLYRGVFVQEFEVQRIWGIEGSIDVDPKHFKPRLNRESFVAGQFQTDVTDFLKSCHPAILAIMVKKLDAAVAAGSLDQWTVKRWANLWLSLPRESSYARTVEIWDLVFRSLPAFELADGNQWTPVSFEEIKSFEKKVYVAPLRDEQSNNDVVQAAVRFLRNTGQVVIRGIRWDKSWMRYARRSFGTTADLISNVFVDELPPLMSVKDEAEKILASINRIAPLFTGPPPVDLVRLGTDSPPVLRLRDRLIVNLDSQAGKALVTDAIRENNGPLSLVGSASLHAYEQLTQVAAVVREISAEPEILGPVRRRYIRDLLS